MPKKALVNLFYNLSTSSLLLLIFLYISSISLPKFFFFIGNYPLIPRTQNGYDYSMFSDDDDKEEEEEEEDADDYGDERCNYKVNCMENDHLVADIIHGCESLVFLPENSFRMTQNDVVVTESVNPNDDDHQLITSEDQEFASCSSTEQSPSSDSEHDDVDTDLHDHDVNQDGPTPIVSPMDESDVDNDEDDDENFSNQEIKQRVQTDFSRGKKFFVIGPPMEALILLAQHQRAPRSGGAQ